MTPGYILIERQHDCLLAIKYPSFDIAEIIFNQDDDIVLQDLLETDCIDLNLISQDEFLADPDYHEDAEILIPAPDENILSHLRANSNSLTAHQGKLLVAYELIEQQFNETSNDD